MEVNLIKKKYEEFFFKPVMNELEIRGGKGVRLTDASGKEYIDFTSGFGISLLGYNNEYTEHVNEAVQKEISRGVTFTHYLYYSEPSIALAEKLSEILPGALKKTFFSCGGTMAVEGAIRAIRKYKNRFELLGLQQGFNGHSMGAASLTGHSKDKRNIGPLLPGVYHIPAPYCFRCSLRHTYPGCNLACADYVEDFLEFGTSGNVAGLVIEPIMGHAGVVVPPDGYFSRIGEICRRHDIAVVADEILTGFGKTGKMFAVDHWEIEPDIMILGKALGGGFPLGAFIVTDDIASALEYRDASAGLGGDSISSTASLTTINLIEKEALHEKAARLGDYLINELRHLEATSEMIGEVRGKGLFIGIEIVEGDNHDKAHQKAQQIKRLMLERGVLLTVYAGSTIRLTPPLIIEQDDIDRFIETFSSVLKNVTGVDRG